MSPQTHTITQPAKARTARHLPYLSGSSLVIPFDAPSKYFWWQGGQSITQTRYELEKPDPMPCTLIPTRRRNPIAPDLPVYRAGKGLPSCPQCDCKTQWDDVTPTLQRHHCLECGYRFLIEQPAC